MKKFCRFVISLAIVMLFGFNTVAQNVNHFSLVARSGPICYAIDDFGWGGSLSVERSFQRFTLAIGAEYFSGYSYFPPISDGVCFPSKKWTGVVLTEKMVIYQNSNWLFFGAVQELFAMSRGKTLHYLPNVELEEINEVWGGYDCFDLFVSPGFGISRKFHSMEIGLTPMLTFPTKNPTQGLYFKMFFEFKYIIGSNNK